MTAPTNPARLDNAIRLYLSGQSALQVESATGVSRSAIKRELLSRGIEPRGRSAAGLNRASLMTIEQRRQQASAAHEASRGRQASMAERCKRAETVERSPGPMSAHEQQFAGWLNERGIPFRREVAVGPYNVDFGIGPIAVEILGGEWHLEKNARHSQRTPYILDQGWSLAFVWATPNCPMTSKAAEQVITWANQFSRDPSSLSEYRVIRGDGHIIATGTEGNEFTGIPASRSGLNRSEVGRLGCLVRWRDHNRS